MSQTVFEPLEVFGFKKVEKNANKITELFGKQFFKINKKNEEFQNNLMFRVEILLGDFCIFFKGFEISVKPGFSW